MKVDQGPGSQLRILLKRAAIQTNSLVGNCPEIRVANLKMVAMKVSQGVKKKDMLSPADLRRVQTEDQLPSHSHIYHLLLSALYPEVVLQLADPLLVAIL
jgi:hypothetical protein